MKVNILALALTLTVGVILIGSILMPVLDEAASDETINTSALGDVHFKEVLPGDTPATFVMLRDEGHRTITTTIGETTSTYEFDGVNSDTVPGSYSVAISDGASCRLMGQTIKMDNGITYSGDYIKITYNYGGTSGSVEVLRGASEEDTSRYTTSFTWAYLPCKDGSMILADGNAVVYPDSPIAYAEYDVETVGGTKTRLTYSWNTTVENFEATFHVSGGTYSVTTDPSCVTSVYKWGGLKLSSVDFVADITVNDDVWTDTHSENVYLVPEKVAATHPLTEYGSLIYVIPVMVIVALLMTAIGAIALRRAD